MRALAYNAEIGHNIGTASTNIRFVTKDSP